MKYAVLSTTAVAVVTAALCSAQPASAQDFGRMLGRLAERTAERAARNAADELIRPREDSDAPSRPDRADSRSSAPGPQERAAPAVTPAPQGVEPWPINAGHRAVVRPTQFAFSPEMIAQKQRFTDASRFPCNTCEGSVDIDSWRRALQPIPDTYSAWSEVIAPWTVGRVVDWRGTVVDGRITVLSEVPVGGFQCRQLRHRISTRGPNPIVTERPGLVCLGKRDAYSGAETWHEVF